MPSKSLPLAIVVAVVLLCAVSWSGYAQRSKTKQPAWEYRAATLSTTYADEKALNDIGAQGWELVGVSEVAGNTVYFFKRPK